MMRISIAVLVALVALPACSSDKPESYASTEQEAVDKVTASSDARALAVALESDYTSRGAYPEQLTVRAVRRLGVDLHERSIIRAFDSRADGYAFCVQHGDAHVNYDSANGDAVADDGSCP